MTKSILTLFLTFYSAARLSAIAYQLYYQLDRLPSGVLLITSACCLVCFGAAGSHPGNVWPVMAGYILASTAAVLLGGPFPINAQAIMVGMCYASGLAPVAGVYGWWAGLLAGGMHYCLVTSIPAIHGGFSLYNGGFTSLLVAAILVPQLETFCKTKEERRQGAAKV